MASLPKNTQDLLADHLGCLTGISCIKLPEALIQPKYCRLTWHGPEPGIRIAGLGKDCPKYRIVLTKKLVTTEVFPEGKLDADLQQVDLRKTNSWRLKLGEIETTEMIEVQLVNSVAPFVLCNRLSEVMKKDNTGQKHIINVSAMEGKFYPSFKEDRHPHTNMAKAALNMLTHTSARTLAKDGIFMNAVDTGWVTDEDPLELAKNERRTARFSASARHC